MLLFFLGFIVGGILGITLMAILAIGSIADKNKVNMLNNSNDISQVKVSKQLLNKPLSGI